MPDIPSGITVLINGNTVTWDLKDIAIWVIVGLTAGFLASRLALGHGLGPVRELLVGVVGAVLGNLAFPFFGVSIVVAGYPIISQIIVAFFGALALVIVMRLVGMGRAARDRGRYGQQRFDRRDRRGRHEPDPYDRYERDQYDRDRYDRDRYDRDGYERDPRDGGRYYEPEPTDWRRTRG